MSSRLPGFHLSAVRPITALVAAMAFVISLCAVVVLTAPVASATPPVGQWPYTAGERTYDAGTISSPMCYDEYEVPPGVTQLGVQVIGENGVDGTDNRMNGTGAPGVDGNGAHAGNSGFGLVQSGALEASNVDITAQLVMIPRMSETRLTAWKRPEVSGA